MCAAIHGTKVLKMSAATTGCISAVASIIFLLISLHFNMANPIPPPPDWPDQFYIDFTVYVEEYGADWKSLGHLAYNWMQKAFKSTFTDWCLPLFDERSGKPFDNYTCSFVAINGNMYFVNDSSSSNWETADCCMFEEGMGAVAPDWMLNGHYNGTAVINGKVVDVWWFPGTMACFGYWNMRNTTTPTPVQFFGLSSIGPAILDCFNFKPGSITDITLPKTDCSKQCEPPMKKARQRNRIRKPKFKKLQDVRLTWPEWPSCE